MHGLIGQGQPWSGEARLRLVRHGKVWFGERGLGAASCGGARYARDWSVPAWPGMEGQGRVWLGVVRQGEAGKGRERHGVAGRGEDFLK